MSATTSLRALTTLAVVLLTSASAVAQFGSLSGPVFGYVVDSKNGDIHPVKGILGSATVGERLDIGVTPSLIVTLGQGQAIAATTDAVELWTLSLDTARITRSPIAGLAGNPTRVSVSLQGNAAAFYYSGSNQIQVVTGLPKEPRFSGAFQTNATVTQMSVHDDGTLVVYSVTAADEESLYAWTADLGSPRFVATASSVSGIAITKSGDAVVADRGANKVFAVWSAGSGAVRGLLADENDGVSDPVGVAVSSAKRIYIANARSGSVIVLDSSGHYLKSYSCNCSVKGLTPIRESVFRLTERIDQTTFLLDATSLEERIVFVPPPLE